MDDIIENTIMTVSVILVVMGIIIGLLWGSYWVSVNITSNNQIEVKVDGISIYKGKSAFVKLETGGMTTTVIIYNRLFPFYVQDRVYSSNNVEVKPI